MCYAKPGHRCSGYEGMRRDALAKQHEEAKQAKMKLDELIANATGSTTMLERKLAVAIEKAIALEAARKDAEAKWEQTPEGIAHLREIAADTYLKAVDREAARVKADRFEALHKKSMEAVRASVDREAALKADLTAAGVPEETIKQVMSMKAESTFGSSVVSSSTAKKNLMQAKKNLARLTYEADLELSREKNPRKRTEVFMANASKLAEAVDRVQLNEAAYLTTPAGIAELEAEADEVNARTHPVRKARLMLKAKEARKTREMQLGANNLRRHRENAIREAMVAAGADPEGAIAAYRKNRKIVPGKPNKEQFKDDLLLMNKKATAMLTPDEIKTVHEAAKAAGVPVGVYTRSRVLGIPTEHMKGHVSDLHAVAPEKPQGTGHRNTTADEPREKSFNFRVSLQHRSIVDMRSAALNVSRSTYLRAMLLGLDARQIQKDRSDVSNNRKAQVMKEKHATPAESAKVFAA